MRHLSLLLIAIVALAGCGKKLQPQESCNFIQNGDLQRVSWKEQTPILFYIHESVPTEFRASIESAINNWENPTAMNRKFFQYQGVITTAELDGSSPKKDGISVVYWMSSWEQDKLSEQARTTVYWIGNQIVEADIRVNASVNNSVGFKYANEPALGYIDLQSLLVHEYGHVLGLAHNMFQKSVMAVNLAANLDRRKPEEADLNSLKCEYAPGT